MKFRAKCLFGAVLSSVAACAFLAALAVAPAQQEANPPRERLVHEKVVHPRGHKPAPPEVRARLHAEAKKRHGDRVAHLPNATAPTWDCRTLGYVLPVNNQGQCGSCYGVSSADGCSMAFIKAGLLPLDTVRGRLSSQYGLDYRDAFQGGCDGGDEAQVIDYIKQYGFPLTSDYGPYTASPHKPKDVSGMKMWKIADWGYCTPSQQEGVANTQDMKNCIVAYGPISVAFDASGCDSYRAGDVMRGRGNNVDHAVLCIGWRTNVSSGKTEFLGYNQWDGWGGDTPQTRDNGTFWIEEGSYSWATESIFMVASTLPPPPTGTATANVTVALPVGSITVTNAAGATVGTLITTATVQPGTYSGSVVPPSGSTAGTITFSQALPAGTTLTFSGLGTMSLAAPVAAGDTLDLSVPNK